jgi:hypothetical protein
VVWRQKLYLNGNFDIINGPFSSIFHIFHSYVKNYGRVPFLLLAAYFLKPPADLFIAAGEWFDGHLALRSP